MICGHCKQRDATTAHVRSCAGAPEGDRVTASTSRPPRQEPATTIFGRKVEDGYYTVTSRTEGAPHRTFRVRTQPSNASFAPGETVINLLTGPDNEQDYRGVAFLKPSGRVFLWRRFKHDSALARAIEALVDDPSAAGELYALESNRCCRCNRRLTVPASIHRGLGPVCAGLREAS